MQKSQRPERVHSAYLRHRNALLGMTASAALLAGLATSADARPFNLQPQGAPQSQVGRQAAPHRTALAARNKAPAKAKQSADDVAAKAKGVLTVVISIDKQRLTLYSDGHPIAHSRVSTGVPSHPTPTGVFSVIQKDRWHRSNLYYNAPMFYMQRITWSGVAMHQGIVPNHPASHGCIRLPEAFARQMWGITKLGARVVIARGEVTPATFAHERLFTIKPLEAKPEPEAAAAEPVKAGHGALEVVGLAANKSNATASDAAEPGNSAFDAMAYAATAPREAEVTASEAVKSAHAAFEAVRPQATDFGTTKSATLTTGEEVRPLKPGPIAVFISRKEGKLFVRKGFEPVFDVPVTFEQPDRPLGTHVYTALSVNDDNTTLRWNVMSMPGGAAAPAKKPVKGKKAEPPPPAVPASNAAEALDRVSIPQDALDRISQLMSPGASLIISDKGLGPETGKGTDFIVLTR